MKGEPPTTRLSSRTRPRTRTRTRGRSDTTWNLWGPWDLPVEYEYEGQHEYEKTTVAGVVHNPVLDYDAPLFILARVRNL